MHFAIYGRKSVYSDKSDSVDNQFRMCREYIDFRFSGQVDSVEQYSDEDYTGANTNRPDLQRLLSDIKFAHINALVVYQLDRLSRDVKDFSNIYSLLEEHNVMFVSIKENIDTTTPIGKAMMYVTVVFAQMERETIAARVTDNMIGLAKKGYWTAGNPPVGFVRENIVINGKKHVTIIPDPDGVEYVEWIFDTFLDNKFSLQRMETYFRKKGIRTQSGAFFSTTQIHKILTMPFCVAGTADVYDFYESKGCQMDPGSPRELWDGTRGVMVYGRSTQKNKKHQLNPPEKWLVCLGIHKPFLSSEKWLAAQNRLAGNKFNKEMKYDVPLLKGVLRCSCGAAMSVSRKKKKNGVSSWYCCTRRMRQGRDACDCSQIKTDVVEKKALDIFRSIESDPAQIKKFISAEATDKTIDVKVIASKINLCEAKIGRLTTSLALSENSTAAKYILTEIEHLDLELQALKRERNLALSENRKHDKLLKSVDEAVLEITRLIQGLDGFNSSERNAIVRGIIKNCTWDGKELSITL